MSTVLTTFRDLIQADPGQRGLASIPGDNLLTACPADLTSACQSIAWNSSARLGVVTGFFIPKGDPPAGETDGPLGALYLARALAPLGIGVAIATDDFCLSALDAGLRACGLSESVSLIELPSASTATSAEDYCDQVCRQLGQPTHLVALERVGPTHTPATLRLQGGPVAEFEREVGPEQRGRCHTMRGLDITLRMRPAHLLFESRAPLRPVTIGIGDGGNEIGMGRIPWRVIRANIPGGGLVACRTPTDHLIVCGVSNWGAYALAAGVLHLRGTPPPAELFDVERERELLRLMVAAGPLVDGVLGKPSVSVDGLPFDQYAEILRRLRW